MMVIRRGVEVEESIFSCDGVNEEKFNNYIILLIQDQMIAFFCHFLWIYFDA